MTLMISQILCQDHETHSQIMTITSNSLHSYVKTVILRQNIAIIVLVFANLILKFGIKALFQ